MFSITKSFFLFFYTFTFLIISSQASAGEICSSDIFGIKLGMTKEAVAKVMLEHGFTGTGIISKRGMMFFGKNDTDPWPPEGVEITAEQSHLMKLMENPRRKAGIEKRAETDPKIKQLLAEIAELPPVPEPKDAVSIIVSMRVRPRPPIVQSIGARYQFPTDNYVPTYSYKDFSSTHKSVDNNAWQKYCADVNRQSSQRFTDKNETHSRSCIFAPDKRGSEGDNIRVTISPHQENKQAGQCSYGYSSSLHQSAKSLATR